MTKESLLIVDAQPRRRRLLEVGLRRAGYRVTVAGEPDQASWFLERSLPDVIVSSFSFERVTGLELARRLRERPEWAQVGLIFVVSNHAEESEASPWADTMIREPVFLRDVVRWVEHVLWRRQIAALARGSRRSVSGDLTRVAAADLFGLVERMAATGTLEVDVPGRPATVWFRDGQILDAVFGPFEAEDAVFRLLGVESGSFEFALKPVAHAGVISTQTGALVMEGLRRLDEWARLCDELPPLTAVLRVNHEVLGHRRGELSAEQFLLLQRCDGRRSIEAVVDQSGQDSLLALEVLHNLLSLGVLVSGTEPPLTEPPLAELPPLPQPFPAFAEGGAADTELVSGIPEEAGDVGSDEPPNDDALPRGYVFRAPLRPVTANREVSQVGVKVADALALAAMERAAVEAALATGRVDAPAEVPRDLGASAERDAVDRALAGARALLQARLRREEERESRQGDEFGGAQGARRDGGGEVRPGKALRGEVRPGGALPAGGPVTRGWASTPGRAVRVAVDGLPRRSGAERADGGRSGHVEVERGPPEGARPWSSGSEVAERGEQGALGEKAEDQVARGGVDLPAHLGGPVDAVVRAELGGEPDDAMGVREPDEAARGVGALAGVGERLELEAVLKRDGAPGGAMGARAEVGAGSTTAALRVGASPEGAGARVGEVAPRGGETVGAPGGADGAGGHVIVDAARFGEADDEDAPRGSMRVGPDGVPADAAGALVVEARVQRANDELRFSERLRQPTILVHRGERPDAPPPERVETVLRRRERSETGESAAGELAVTSPRRRRAGPELAAAAAKALAGAGREVPGAPAGDAGDGDWDESGQLVPASSEDMGRLSALAEAFVRGGGSPDAPAESARGRLQVPQPVPEAPVLSARNAAIAVLVVSVVVWLAMRFLSSDEGPAPVDRPTAERDGKRPATTGVKTSVKTAARAGSARAEEAKATKATKATETAATEGGAPRRAVSAEDRAAAVSIVEAAERLYGEGKVGAASLEVARALARDPASAAALVLRAKISLDQKEPARAREAIGAALRSAPEYSEAYLTLAVIEEEEGRVAEAIAAYERYLELAPDARYATSVRRQLAALRRKPK